MSAKPPTNPAPASQHPALDQATARGRRSVPGQFRCPIFLSNGTQKFWWLVGICRPFEVTTKLADWTLSSTTIPFLEMPVWRGVFGPNPQRLRDSYGMTALADTLSADIKKILGTAWNSRSGQVVPETDNVALSNGAVKLNAVVLYADLAHSTQIARKNKSTAAKVVRAYLSTMARLVTSSGGVVRSFDGDRVMGIFVGDMKNTNAARCALKMNYVLTQMLRPQVSAKFTSMKDFTIKHCVGISWSEVLVVRGGIRESNDLVFVGTAPNLAAKLSEIRNSPWNTYITHNVYGQLDKPAKIGSGDRNMWTSTKRTVAGEEWHLYKSTWHWKP
jgi:adenylate cyclase